MNSSGHGGSLLHRELPKPSKELAGVRSHDELQMLLARQQELVRAAGADPAVEHRQQQEEEGVFSPRTLYQQNIVAREQLSLQLLMHLNGEQMASIKAEFHAHDDEVDLEDFCAIMERHQPENLIVKSSDSTADGEGDDGGRGDGRADGGGGGGGGGGGAGGAGEGRSSGGGGGGKVVVSREEVVSNLVELFKEVDINGDGMMEWDEFTRFVVVKAQLHHAQMSIDQLAEYRQGPRQVEVTSYNRSCEAVEQLCYVPGSYQLAVIQEHNPIVNLYNTHSWSRVAQLKHNAVPLAMAYSSHHTLITASADMTLLQWHLDDVPAIKHYTLKSRWPTKHAAMSMCWSSSHRLLYSGTTAGTIQGWDIGERQEMVTLKGHTDIVMGMIVMESLDNLVSASLDTSIRVWDTYTQKPVHTLLGHNKGVHSLSYSSQYRCLVSAGFDHEAHVWSPFVNSLLNRLKGHHASLVGCQAVEGTPELITADTSGIVKLWDLRTFHCVQTFQPDNEGELPRDKASLSCFVHFKMPPARSNQEQDDHRLVLARGKRLLPFDQYRCKTEAITDDFAVTCACFNKTSLTILTATERTVKIWDAVGGILKGVFKGITEADITAVCLDDRERKFILGNAKGEVAVYNFRNGAKMKDLDTQAGPIVGLVYCAQEKAVLVACQDGEMVCYDEMDPDKAVVLVNFEGCGSAYTDDLNNVALSHHNGLVATSSCNPEDGILIWGFGTGRQEHVLAHGKAEGLVSSVSSLAFLDPHPLLLATYSDGTVRVWGVKGSRFKGMLLLAFPNQAPREASFRGGKQAEYPLLRLKATTIKQRRSQSKKRRIISEENKRDPEAPRREESEGNVAIGSNGVPTDSRALLDRDHEQPKNTPNNDDGADNAPGEKNIGRKESNNREGSDRESSEEDDGDGNGGSGVNGDEFSEWRVHPRLTPRKDSALQVISTAWDSATGNLYTGDETGRLRCWSLQRVLLVLGAQPSTVPAVPAEGHAKGLASGASCSVVASGGGSSGGGITGGGLLRSQGSDSRRGSRKKRQSSDNNLMSPPAPFKALSPDTVDFKWGAESAHEDSIGLVLLVSIDPPALLTSGADRCVKAWTLDGRPQGLLLQGLAPHAPNPRWSFSVNVEALSQAEAAAARSVLERIDERSKDKLLRKKAAEQEALMFPHPSGKNRTHQKQPRPSHHRKQHQNRRRSSRSASASNSLPSSAPSPLKQAQILRQRREAATLIGEDSIGGSLASEKSGDDVKRRVGAAGAGERNNGEGGGGNRDGSTTASSGPAGRNAALRQAASDRPGRSSSSSRLDDSASDWTSCSSSSRRTALNRSIDRPSVIPPSPGFKRGEPSAGLEKIVARLGKLLDEAESFSDAHTNRFSGRRSHMADFVRGAKLADPRRTSGSGKSVASGSSSVVSATTTIPSMTAAAASNKK